MDTFLDFLKEINDNYSQLALAIIALLSLLFAYNEFVLKIRPYILPEIAVDQNSDGNWYFNIILSNKGERPGIARITKAILQIGDEKYATPFQLDTVISPGETKNIYPIGHINESGRNKIKGNNYANNSVQIFLEIESKAIGDKKFKYKTTEEYFIDVTGEKRVITLLKEELN